MLLGEFHDPLVRHVRVCFHLFAGQPSRSLIICFLQPAVTTVISAHFLHGNVIKYFRMLQQCLWVVDVHYSN